MIIGFIVLALLFFIGAFLLFKDKNKKKKYPLASIVLISISGLFLLLLVIFSFVAIPYQGYNFNTTSYDLKEFNIEYKNEEETLNIDNIYLGRSEISNSLFYQIVYEPSLKDKYEIMSINRSNDKINYLSDSSNIKKIEIKEYTLKNGFFSIWFYGYISSYKEITFYNLIETDIYENNIISNLS